MDANCSIEIGDNVALAGARVQIWTHSTWPEIVEGFSFKKEKVSIADDCYIGTGAIILPGVSIGKGSVIGAGAVVTKSIPKNSIAVGMPAKIIGRNRSKKLDKSQKTKIIRNFLESKDFTDFSFYPDTSKTVVFCFEDLEIKNKNIFNLKNKTCTIVNKKGIKVRNILKDYVARFREVKK